MANYKIISDRLNTFFTNNNISIGTSIPTTGTYSRGDIIVNVGPTSSIEPMWICNEGGSPGVWGLVGVGGNDGSGELVCMNETVTVDGPVNEVSLGDLAGLVTDKDKLTVHFNSTHLMQGVDFEISADKTKIIKLTEGSWNESGIAGSMFAFELLKNVEVIENGNIVLESKLISITNSVIVGANVSEVEIGVDGLNKDDDTLLVFKNGVMMVEGVDYNISDDNTKIISIGEVWNKDGLDDYCIAYVVFKEVALYDGENGSVTMDMLGTDVKDTLNNLTETTLQHSEILANLDDTYATKDDIANIKPVDLSGKQDVTDNNLATTNKTIVGAINEVKNSIDNKDLSNYQEKTDNNLATTNKNIVGAINEVKNSIDNKDLSVKQNITDNNLATTNKTIVGAINELFQNANNGKQLIASAIGEPLSATNTFTAMSEEIEELLEYFRDKLRSIGVTDSLDNLKLKELIDKVRGPNKYSITKNLTNCTINNNTTIIEENNSYNATITANSNYTMKSITVTMGGVNVTNNVVTGSNINIASVTGDIVISANAEVDNPYPPGTNVNNTVSKFSAYQYNPVTKSIPVEADGNYTLSFRYGPNISNQGYTASVTVRIVDAEDSTVDSYNKSTDFGGSIFSTSLTLKKGYSIEITARISVTTHSSHCNQVSGIELVFNSL